MMMLVLPLAAAAFTAAAAAAAPGQQRPWFDQSLPRAERVSALVHAMTTEVRRPSMRPDSCRRCRRSG